MLRIYEKENKEGNKDEIDKIKNLIRMILRKSDVL